MKRSMISKVIYDKHPGRMKAEAGFTLIELMISMTVLVVGIMGLFVLANSAIQGNKFSGDMTIATLLAVNKMEEIKRVATNEPGGGGSLGFSYLISDTSGYLSTMTQLDDWTYTDLDTVDGINRTWTIQTYPSGGSNPSFDTPNQIDTVKVSVVTQWVEKSSSHEVKLESLMHRRQFLP